MTYFDCFVIASWMFAIGWFVGAIYVQNHNEKTEGPRVSENPERCPECEAWRLPVAASATAD
ncbi:MAG TPA: hypothetical protein VMH03_03045 [Terriglobales bacterium]|nr:hypothetical protein [Terriglobales bacterium]